MCVKKESGLGEVTGMGSNRSVEWEGEGLRVGGGKERERKRIEDDKGQKKREGEEE